MYTSEKGHDSYDMIFSSFNMNVVTDSNFGYKGLLREKGSWNHNNDYPAL